MIRVLCIGIFSTLLLGVFLIFARGFMMYLGAITYAQIDLIEYGKARQDSDPCAIYHYLIERITTQINLHIFSLIHEIRRLMNEGVVASSDGDHEINRLEKSRPRVRYFERKISVMEWHVEPPTHILSKLPDNKKRMILQEIRRAEKGVRYLVFLRESMEIRQYKF